MTDQGLIFKKFEVYLDYKIISQNGHILKTKVKFWRQEVHGYIGVAAEIHNADGAIC